jgi:pyridoxamine 5'-phosphate oxidase
MPNTLWMPSLVLALFQNRHVPASRFVQMATVTDPGRPANRTLVFRGFLNETAQLTFATDLRSQKCNELARTPWVEICWYFPATHEQFRVGGTISVIGAEATDPLHQVARQEAWRALPESTRVTYTWPAPGLIRDVRTPFPTEPPDPETPLPHFGLLVLHPEEVDLLEINGHPQNRWEFRSDATGRWSGIEVNP